MLSVVFIWWLPVELVDEIIRQFGLALVWFGKIPNYELKTNVKLLL